MSPAVHSRMNQKDRALSAFPLLQFVISCLGGEERRREREVERGGVEGRGEGGWREGKRGGEEGRGRVKGKEGERSGRIFISCGNQFLHLVKLTWFCILVKMSVR